MAKASYTKLIIHGAIVLFAIIGALRFIYRPKYQKVEPSFDCYAHPDSDEAVPADAWPGKYEGWINVSRRFAILLYLPLCTFLIDACIILPARFYYTYKHKKKYNDNFATADQRDKMDPTPDTIRKLNYLVIFVEIVWVFLLLLWRRNHLARVCSGELLTD